MDGASVALRRPERIETYYGHRIDQLLAQEGRLVRRDAILTHVRLGVFLLAASCVFLGFRADSGARLWFTAGGLTFVGFVCAIAVHERVEERLRNTRNCAA